MGAFNTAFGYLGFVVLVATLGHRIHYVLLLTAVHMVSVLVAFVMYRYVVFRARGQVLRDLFRFWLVYAGTFGFNLIALPFLVHLGMAVIAAQTLLVSVIVVSTYLGHKNFSFRRPAPAQPTEPSKQENVS